MTIFVLGKKGMLGRYVYTYLKSQEFNVIGLARPQVDALNMSTSFLTIMGANENDVVINCIGMIKRNDATKSEYALVNSAFPHVLADACEKIGCQMIHVTTDCVFDGHGGNYNEDHEHTAKDVYGMSKSVGEPENATVIRTSVIGEELENSRSLLEWVKSNRGKTVNGFTNHFWNGITCLQFAKVCEHLINTKFFWHGVKHIISPTSVTKQELVQTISDIYKLGMTVNPLETPNKCDRTLSSIGVEIPFVIPELKDQIKEMKEFRSVLDETC